MQMIIKFLIFNAFLDADKFSRLKLVLVFLL